LARSGTFKKGNTKRKDGVSGRQAGVPNKTTQVMKDALILAAEACGDLSGIKHKDLSKAGVEHGKDGLPGYLRWAAKCEPRAFLRLLGRLMPMQVKVDTFTQTVYRSGEEIKHDISQRGLNMRAFGQLLLEAHQAKEEVGENGDLIEHDPNH
jgi:hypothetical protein